MLNLQPIEYVGRVPRRSKRKKGPNFFGGWFLLMLVIAIGFVFVRPIIPFLQSQQSQASAANAQQLIGELQDSGEFTKKLAAAALKPGEYRTAVATVPDPRGDTGATMQARLIT